MKEMQGDLSLPSVWFPLSRPVNNSRETILKKIKPEKKEREGDEFSLDGAPKKYNTTSLAGTAQGCDGAGMSSRIAVRICNLYAKDVGYLTWENRHTHTFDASKLDKWRRRERAKQTTLKEKEISEQPVRAVLFDGKKTATLVWIQEKKGNLFTKSMIEDHYIMIEEPQSIFLEQVVLILVMVWALQLPSTDSSNHVDGRKT